MLRTREEGKKYQKNKKNMGNMRKQMPKREQMWNFFSSSSSLSSPHPTCVFDIDLLPPRELIRFAPNIHRRTLRLHAATLRREKKLCHVEKCDNILIQTLLTPRKNNIQRFLLDTRDCCTHENYSPTTPEDRSDDEKKNLCKLKPSVSLVAREEID